MKCLYFFILSTYFLNMFMQSTYAYPDPNTLTPDMQWLIYDLTADVNDELRPQVELAYNRMKARERSDLNNDGVIDLQDLAIWTADYSLCLPKQPETLPESQTKPQELVIHWPADITDPCFIECLAGLEN